jgi:hypothetical protein
MTCEVCGRAAPEGLYLLCTGVNAGTWACFDCQPAHEVDQYAGWRERVMAKRQRAEQAKKNFGQDRF